MAGERGCPVKLEFIPVWDVDLRWNEVAPLLEKPLALQSAMSLESVHNDCRTGKFHLWSIPGEVAFVTEIQQFPMERICMIVLCGGDNMEGWIDEADKTLTRYALSMGCKAMMIVGRSGWSRVNTAYRIQDTVMRKSL